MEVTIFPYILALIISLAFMWVAGDRAVHYASQTAYLFGVTSFFIGFVLLAMMTGLPELSVTIFSTRHDASMLSAGTILGSNFSDISLVLGIPAFLVGAIEVRKSDYVNSVFMLLVTTLVMSYVFVIGTLTKFEGIVLMMLYFFCLWQLWKSRYHVKISREGHEKAEESVKEKPVLSSKLGTLLKLGISIFGVVISSELAVHSARAIAQVFNVGLGVIGSTIFAMGTSLPELSLSLIALKRKDYALVIGNALGSVLQQGTFILGILALVSPSQVHLHSLRSIAPFMFLAFGITGYGIIQKGKIDRLLGALLVLLYVMFIIYRYMLPHFV